MPQADLHYTTTRRTALAAIAGAAGVATTLTPAIAARVSPVLAEPDPIYAAIEARKKASARMSEITARYGDYQESHRKANGALPDDEQDAALEKQQDAAADVDNEAILIMLSTTPTTLAGTLALLQYVAACENESEEILMVCDDDSRYGYHALVDTLITALKPLSA